MKNQKYRQPCIDYGHVSNVVIGVDSTDHIAFFCPRCKKTMNVAQCFTKKIVVTMDGNKKDYCTWISLICDDCKVHSQRKFYWMVEDGRYCSQLTKKKFDRSFRDQKLQNIHNETWGKVKKEEIEK